MEGQKEPVSEKELLDKILECRELIQKITRSAKNEHPVKKK